MTVGRADVVFSVIHQREVAFLVEAGRRLAAFGLAPAYVAFHDGATDMVAASGFPVVSVHRLRRAAGDLGGARRRLSGLPPVDPLLPDLESRIRHERLVFARGRERLVAKTLDYEAVLGPALDAWGAPTVVQELSGFIAPLALYVASRRRGLSHLFMEPAMYARRLVFTRNALEARLPRDAGEPLPPEDRQAVRAYVDGYARARTVLIPVKDRQFFTDATARALLTPGNLRKLGRKLAHKYLLGVPEEYDAIGEYVRRHALKIVRRRLLDRLYSAPAAGERFVYFPFHVPLDVQLTLRSPAFLEQERLATTLAGALPAGVRLYVKEHPAAIGAHRLRAVRALLETGRVRLIHPATNSFELIRDAAAVVTVNSKAGAEALMQGRPVVVVGKAFYRGHGATYDVDDLGRLGAALEAALAGRPDGAAVERLLVRSFGVSRPGELFDADSANVEVFVASLLDAMGRDVAAVGG